MQSNLSITTDFNALVEEKRKKTIQKIKDLPADELQLIFQSLFINEIIEGFDNLPKPRNGITEEQLVEALTKKRIADGFYK